MPFISLRFSMEKNMKKHISFLVLCLASFSIFAKTSEKSWQFTNTSGANLDKTGGRDLFEFNYSSEEEKIKWSQDISFFNRLQFDFKNNFLESRIRLENLCAEEIAKEDEFAFPLTSNSSLKFYANYSPLPFISLGFGNSYFGKFEIRGSELQAFDDTSKFGKMIREGLSLSTNLFFGEEENINLRAALALHSDFMYGDSSLKLSFGHDFKIKNLFSFGSTFQNITSYKRKIGIYASADFIKNFKFNAGFVYNNTDTSFLPKESLYSLTLSAGYKVKSIGLGFYADCITGLSDKYLGGDEIKSYSQNQIPYVFALRAEYSPWDFLKLETKVIRQNLFSSSSQGKTVIYPFAEYSFGNEHFTLSGGLRFTFNEAISSGLTSLGIPLTLKVSI